MASPEQVIKFENENPQGVILREHLKMNKFMVAFLSMLVSNVALATALTHFSLDNRTRVRGSGVREVLDAGVNLRYDAGWYRKGSQEGFQARVTDNGICIASGRRGILHWAPTCGEHHLQLTVVDGYGAQIGSETVDFYQWHGRYGQLVAKSSPDGVSPTAVDLKCTRCGVVFWSGLLSVDGAWVYQLEDGEVTIARPAANLAEIAVPAVIDGYPVVHIGDYAFSSCGNLSRVEIPCGRMSISATAFAGCTNVQEVVLAASAGPVSISGPLSGSSWLATDVTRDGARVYKTRARVSSATLACSR